MELFVKILFFLLVFLFLIFLIYFIDFSIFFKKKIYLKDVNISFKEECTYKLKMVTIIHKGFMKFKVFLLSNGKIYKYKTIANVSQEINYNYFNYSKNLNIGSIILQEKFENIKKVCEETIVYKYKEGDLTIYEMELNEKCLKNVFSSVNFQGYKIKIDVIKSNCKFYTKNNFIEKIICKFDGTSSDISFNGELEVIFS